MFSASLNDWIHVVLNWISPVFSWFLLKEMLCRDVDTSQPAPARLSACLIFGFAKNSLCSWMPKGNYTHTCTSFYFYPCDYIRKQHPVQLLTLTLSYLKSSPNLSTLASTLHTHTHPLFLMNTIFKCITWFVCLPFLKKVFWFYAHHSKLYFHLLCFSPSAFIYLFADWVWFHAFLSSPFLLSDSAGPPEKDKKKKWS